MRAGRGTGQGPAAENGTAAPRNPTHDAKAVSRGENDGQEGKSKCCHRSRDQHQHRRNNDNGSHERNDLVRRHEQSEHEKKDDFAPATQMLLRHRPRNVAPQICSPQPPGPSDRPPKNRSHRSSAHRRTRPGRRSPPEPDRAMPAAAVLQQPQQDESGCQPDERAAEHFFEEETTARPAPNASGWVNISSTVTVRNTDIGVVKPDSISSVAVTRSGTATRAVRKSVFTAAASVGASTAPMSSASFHGIARARRLRRPQSPQ